MSSWCKITQFSETDKERESSTVGHIESINLPTDLESLHWNSLKSLSELAKNIYCMSKVNLSASYRVLEASSFL